MGSPLVPDVWRQVSTMTIGFGHGIAVSPLQMAAGVAAMVNGGEFRQPSLIKRASGRVPEGVRVVSERTSKKIRKLMRLVVERRNRRPGRCAGLPCRRQDRNRGESGAGGYRRRALLSSFIGAFPTDEPRYVVFALLDEPKGTKKTHGYATGGWVAAPVVGRVVQKIGPIAGIRPYDPELPQYAAMWPSIGHRGQGHLRLTELLNGAELNQATVLDDLTITGLTADSRAVRPGFLFARSRAQGLTAATISMQRFAQAPLPCLRRRI